MEKRLRELVAVIVSMTILQAFEEVRASVLVAQCRSNCLEVDQKIPCEKESECQMCWEMCHLLRNRSSPWEKLCQEDLERNPCGPRCRRACTFHWYHVAVDFFRVLDLEKLDAPSKARGPDLKIHYEEGRHELTWTLQSPAKVVPAVTMVAIKDGTSPWEWLPQTDQSSISLGAHVLRPTHQIRVLVVTAKDGTLVDRIFNASDLVLAGPRLGDVPPWKVIHIEPVVVTQDHQSLGIEAVVRWQPHHPEHQYEVVWESINDAIAITGHLYSKTNNATITLWPEGLYFIKVSCLTKEGDNCGLSYPYIINTLSPWENYANDAASVPSSEAPAPHRTATEDSPPVVVTRLEQKCFPYDVALGILIGVVALFLVLCAFVKCASSVRSPKVKCTTTLPPSQTLKFHAKSPISSPVSVSPAESTNSYFIFDLPKSTSKPSSPV